MDLDLGAHPALGALDVPVSLNQRVILGGLTRSTVDAVLVSNLVDDSVSTASVARCHDGLHLLLRLSASIEGR